MQKFTFTNTKEQSITVKDNFPYLLQELKGIGSPDVETLSQRGYQQDGETYYGSLLNPRYITFNVVISDSDRSALLELRENIFKVFNPRLGLGTVSYHNGDKTYTIKASVLQGPVEVVDKSARNASMQTFQIAIYCPRPAWEIVQADVEMTGFEGGVEFGEVSAQLDNPFELGEGEDGLMLATQGDYAEIDYNGTLDAPLTIVFHGPATQPKITNVTTGEYIEVSIELLEGEKLIIETQPDAIDVYMEDTQGAKTPAFNYINPYSTYFLLTPGTNEIKFSVGSGDPQVVISYSEQHVGV